jgi:hypothetical protein
MANWVNIDAATSDRLATALSFIIDGRAVGFPGFVLVVSDRVLRIDVEYPSLEPNETEGQELVSRALLSIDHLIQSESAYAAALSHLPRQIALIYTDGKGDVEVARLSGGKIMWHGPAAEP